MGNTFKSWNDVSESRNRSAQVYVAPNGQRFKVVIKMQSNTKFMVKTVNEMELLDGNSNMTNKGAAALKNYLNSQQAFLNTYSKIDKNFFSTKFIIYTVKRDNSRVEKIQFTVTPRENVEGLADNVQFVSTESLQAMKDKETALAGVIVDNEKTAETDTIEEDPEKIPQGETGDGEGTDVTEESMGNRFRYTMRTNGVDYEAEIGAGGTIEMEPLESGAAIGSIAWEDGKVIWYTDADNTGTIDNSPLMMDGEIENPYDKKFFTSMFTNKDFKNKVIKEWEERYGSSELNGENLKSMLYYRDGTPIFNTSSQADDIAGASSPDTVNKVSLDSF